jgi:hypothetical protein
VSPPPWDPPENWRGSVLNSISVLVQGIVAGTWHHRSPGETRVHIDVSGLVSFYDPELKSLLGLRRGVAQQRHQLAGISPADVEKKVDELRNVLMRDTRGSGINWRSIANVVIERYAHRLQQLNYTLSPDTAFPSAKSRATSVREQLLIMLAPFLTPNDIPLSHCSGPSWIVPVIARCSNAHVGHITDATFGQTPQERLIRTAFLETTREVCRRVGLLWVEAYDIEGADGEISARAVERWRMDVSELMEWLNWSVWRVCRPGCAPDVSPPSRKPACNVC